MGVDAGSVYSSVRIRLDSLDNDLKGVYARLGQLEKNLKKIPDSTKPAEKGFGDMFKAVVTGQAVLDLAKKGFSLLTSAIKDSIRISTEAQEVISKYDVVFSDMGDASEEAAQRFADSFDLAGATAKEMLSNTGNLLQGMGATREESLRLSLQVNTLAGDLASFTNNAGGSKVASEALTKALLGEREQMKTLGIAILETDVQARVAKNGQNELQGTALKLARAQATLQLITEQSKNAIGDYARTQDSSSNIQKRAAESTKELQIAVGTALNPAVTIMADLWDRVASSLSDVIGKQNELKAARDKVEKGEADATDNLLVLQNKRAELLESQRRLYSQGGGYVEQAKKANEEALKKVNEEIAAYTQLEKVQRIAARSKAEQAAADESLQKLIDDRLTKEENALKNISEISKETIDSQKTKYEELEETIIQLSAYKFKDAKSEEERIKAIGILRDQQKDILDTQLDEELTEKKKIWDAEFKAKEDEARKNQELYEKDLEAFKKLQQQKKDTLRDTYAQLQSTVDAYYDYEYAKIDQNYSIDKQNILDSSASEEEKAERIKKLDRDVAVEKAKIAQQQAVWNKLNTIATIGMNTATAITSALTIPPPFGVIAAGVVGGLAATQLALVAATPLPPIPSYATGGIVAPRNGGQLATVAENGYPEYLFNTGPSGDAFIDKMGTAIGRYIVANMPKNATTVILDIDSIRMAEVVAKPINDGLVRVTF